MTVAGPKRKREGNDAARVFVGRMIHRTADLGFLVGKARLADPPHGSLQIDKLLLSNSMRRPPYPLPVDMVRTAILRGGRDAILGTWSKLVADSETLAERSAALMRLEKLQSSASDAAKIDLQSLVVGQGLIAPAGFDMDAFLSQARQIKDLALMLSIRLSELQTPKVNRPSGENVLQQAYVISVGKHWSDLFKPWPRARTGWYVALLEAGWRDLDFPVKRDTDLYSTLGRAIEKLGKIRNVEQ